jgi:tripartite-type tricarboxylate transporter receptor subunit TctC
VKLPRASLFAVMMVATVAVQAQTASTGSGQAYPQKSIRIIVPFPAGGTTDILARAIGQKLTEQWKQAVIVDNRPGAGANIGAEVAAKSPPDGYTLLGISTAHTINPSLYSKLAYDPVKDFAGDQRCRGVADTHRASVAAGENGEGIYRLRQSQAG